MTDLLKVKQGKKKKHPRLPNGTGSIVTLSGNRRRPYMARPPVTKFDAKGYPVYQKPIGYFADWWEAYDALREYNKNPYDVANRNMTFREVYEAWYKEKYEANRNKKYSAATIYCTKSGFKNCSVLHDKVFSELNTFHFQQVLDNCTLKHASIEHIKNLFRQMSTYALKYDIIQKDYSALTTINQADDDEGGVPFTEDEIKILWENKDKKYVDVALILIYSGYRIGALEKLEVNLEERYFKGGVKTRASKNRIVPIHPAIFPLVERNTKDGGRLIDSCVTSFRRAWKAALSELGVKGHTPHDCRHTFASLLHSAKVDPLIIKLLMGHSLSGDITEQKYIHKTLEELREGVEQIKVCH